MGVVAPAAPVSDPASAFRIRTFVYAAARATVSDSATVSAPAASPASAAYAAARAAALAAAHPMPCVAARATASTTVASAAQTPDA